MDSWLLTLGGPKYQRAKGFALGCPCSSGFAEFGILCARIFVFGGIGRRVHQLCHNSDLQLVPFFRPFFFFFSSGALWDHLSLGFGPACLLHPGLEPFLLHILGCSILWFVLLGSSFLSAVCQKLLKSCISYAIFHLCPWLVTYFCTFFYHRFSRVLESIRDISVQFIFLNQKSTVVYVKLE